MPPESSTSRPLRKRWWFALAQSPRWLIALLLMVGIVVLVLGSPVLLPILAIVQWRVRQRLKRLVTGFACVRCGTLLTAQAVTLADAYRKQQAIELQRRIPQTRFRFIESVHAICPACGVQYRCDEQQGFLLPCEQGVAALMD